MALPLTEATIADSPSIDEMPVAAALARMLAAQAAALNSVNTAITPISNAAREMANALQSGGRLVYAAAGSSALMAIADGLELGGTFGITPDQIVLLMAGGLPINASMPGQSEDDTAEAEIAAKSIRKNDIVITISASGHTPYACKIAQLAKAKGVGVIGIANNANAPLFEHADIAIHLPTPPEVIAGSTRLGAATAQKAVLNMMSTLMGVHLGHVHDGMMVNLVADNAKLRTRAVGMVGRIANVDVALAQRSLDRANGAVKLAVLLAAGVTDLTETKAMLQAANGNLRAALTDFGFYD